MAAGGLQIAGAIIGVGANLAKAHEQQKAFAAEAAASIAGENVRELQMQYESARSRRQAVREAVVARSMNLTAGANQGAQYGSGVAGGVASAVTQGAENVQGVNASEILGRRVFRANRLYHVASANAQASMGIAGGIADIGGALFNSADALSNLFGN